MTDRDRACRPNEAGRGTVFRAVRESWRPSAPSLPLREPDTRVDLGPLFYFAVVASPVFGEVPLWLPSTLLALELCLTIAWAILHLGMGRRLPTSHNLAGRAGGILLFALLVWITANLPTAGVTTLGAVAVVVAVVSVAWYLRDAYRDVSPPVRGDAGGIGPVRWNQPGPRA